MPPAKRAAPAQPKLLTEAARAQLLEDLEALVLASAMTARKLLADDLAKLAKGREARSTRSLSLAAHRLQLVHGQAQELHR